MSRHRHSYRILIDETQNNDKVKKAISILSSYHNPRITKLHPKLNHIMHSNDLNEALFLAELAVMNTGVSMVVFELHKMDKDKNCPVWEVYK